jgi:hypothetical protein
VLHGARHRGDLEAGVPLRGAQQRPRGPRHRQRQQDPRARPARRVQRQDAAAQQLRHCSHDVPRGADASLALRRSR